MKILLDTHVIIWALTQDERLSELAESIIASPENIVCFSVASLWEIAVKNQKKPDKCPYREDEVNKYCLLSGYEPINILPNHIMAVRNLQVSEGKELSNMDPFDRLLLAQAKAENCVLFTHDANFRNYDEKNIRMI